MFGLCGEQGIEKRCSTKKNRLKEWKKKVTGKTLRKIYKIILPGEKTQAWKGEGHKQEIWGEKNDLRISKELVGRLLCRRP